MMNSRTLTLPARSAPTPAPGRGKPLIVVIKPRSTSVALKPPLPASPAASSRLGLAEGPDSWYQLGTDYATGHAIRQAEYRAGILAALEAPDDAATPSPVKPRKPRQPSPAAEAMRERAGRTRAELARRFPACLVPKGAPPKPLMIGIAEQLYDACPDIDRHDLMNTLANYTSEANYYQATIAGAERIDLSGAAVGVVTPAAENHAKARLRRMALMRVER